MKKRAFYLLGTAVALLLFFGLTSLSAAEAADFAAHGGHDLHHQALELGKKLPLWTAIPFAGILLSIALFPLFAPKFWHHHYPKVALFWALLLAIPFLISQKQVALYEIVHIYVLDYIPFIILLFGLFTVSGGILLKGTLVGTPALNTLILAIGTVLASLMGTTGASMILIRPLLRANKTRKAKVHIIIFFIFLVSNIGGSLTPLGDPPLFLGFLHGVPFFWTLKLLPEYLFASSILLGLFYIYDSYIFRREGHVFPVEEKQPLRLEGSHNFLFLLGIMGAVLMSGTWKPHFHFTIYHVEMPLNNLSRDLLILLIAFFSLKTTKSEIHRGNEFGWEPIREVAYLFAGIFITIIPALGILKAGEAGALGGLIRSVDETWHYFWATGLLSSFLDNAPTYLTFFNTALGKLGLNETTACAYLLNGAVLEGANPMAVQKFAEYLKAVSVGAVFMGANTYIGNAPNFMVRSIAIESGINMPSFFGYFFKYAIPILFPIFILITLIFFSH
jgi:Na+/H+ antiporter NhaD/arsenite permease-like protein